MKINKKLEELEDALWTAQVKRDIGICNIEKMNRHIRWLCCNIQKEIKKQKAEK